jgi:hypothetical protein
MTEAAVRTAAERQRELIHLAGATPERRFWEDLAMLAVIAAGMLSIALWGVWAVLFAAAVGGATWLVAARQHEARRRVELVRLLQALDLADSLDDARARILRRSLGTTG